MIAEEFVIPKYVRIEDGATDDYARFVVEPFERGYGTTVGNSLRRVLLASLQGSAVTAIRIEGVQHEFSGIPGVKEDVTDVVLALKRARISLHREEPLIFSFKHSGAGNVTMGDLFKGTDVEVFNAEQVVFTCTAKDTKLELELKVARGRGYVTAERFELEHAPIGTIYLDANFSPVTKVNFMVEDARVGQTTDYDRLILDIWTNGSIGPEAALQEASGLMIDHLRIFVQQKQESESEARGGTVEDEELIRMLARPVEELELSVRASNCLKAAKIHTIADLVRYKESDMLGFHNFGKKSLDEIKVLLEASGLSLGMEFSAAVVNAVSHMASAPSPPAAVEPEESEVD